MDAAGPAAAFEIAQRSAPAPYRLRFASTRGGHVRASCGAEWRTEPLSSVRADRVDTVIISGGNGVREAVNDKALIASVRRLAKGARRMASVCSGAFVLGVAGLLEQKRATTHWRRTGHLSRAFPSARVEPDSIWTKDGAIWTSAGISAGIDLSLAMIADDFGADAARDVAREMVVYAQRTGGQTQHSAMLELAPPGGRFAALGDWMRAHLRDDLSVERLAAQAGMSARNFARAFGAETGMTPAKAVERLRLEAARAAIEAGAPHLQEVAIKTGFGDPERMRRAFIRVYGAPPALLKRTLRPG